MLSVEVARTGVRQVTAGTARIGKRSVTETRTLTVQIRREKLYVEHTAAPEAVADPADGPARPVGAGVPAMSTDLRHEEVTLTDYHSRR